MQNNTFETLIGAIVVLVAAGFLYYAYAFSNSSALSGYELSARFQRVDGLNVGTDVRLSGIKIGTIASLSLDPKTYQATAHLSIRSDIQLPEDSSVMVTNTGLLGNSYLSVSPGGSDAMLKPGGVITNTQGSVDLMSLIGRFATGATGGGSAPPAAAPAPSGGHP